MNAPRQTASGILRALGTNPELVAELDKLRREMTVLFTDMKGSTAYVEKYGDAAGIALIHSALELQRAKVEERGGRVLKTIGDSIMATFHAPLPGVMAAIDIQRGLGDFNKGKPAADAVAFRIGLNFGLGIYRSDDIFGDVVNVASRVQGVAQPDQIVISASVREKLDESSGLKIVALGKFTLRGKEAPQELFEVVWQAGAPEHHAAAHTFFQSASEIVKTYKLGFQRADGTPDSIEVDENGLTIGRAEGDLQFPEDRDMAPLHVRLVVRNGQLIVEDLSQGGDVFIRLIGPYLLQDGDMFRMSRHVFQFHASHEALSTAAEMATTLCELSASLPKSEAPAELVILKPPTEGDAKRLGLVEEEVVLGRSKGTFTFPDDPYMSRSHARLTHRGEDFFLEDLGSRNGTHLKVRGEAPVPNGALLQFGGQALTISEQ